MKHFFNTDLSNILNFFYFISNENKWKKKKYIIQPNENEICVADVLVEFDK